MPLILRIPEPLPLEDMAQMSSTIITHNLDPHHAQTRIGLLAHSSRNCVPECGPSAARIKFVVGLVEWRVAAGAGVDAGGWVVFVELAGAGRFGAFLAEDAELFYVKCVSILSSIVYRGRGRWRWRVVRELIIPGLSWACHSPSVFCTGKLVLSAMVFELDPKSAPRNGILGIDLRTVARWGAWYKVGEPIAGLSRSVEFENVCSVRMRVGNDGKRIKRAVAAVYSFGELELLEGNQML